jgi:hypothetical protein
MATSDYQNQVTAVATARRLAYEAQSDGLFFEWQRGDGTEAALACSRSSSKSRQPIPTSTMNKNAQLQTADQTLKGAVLALGSYIAHKNNVDPQIIALSVPVAAGLMAWISTLVGNKNTACLFVDNDPDKK